MVAFFPVELLGGVQASRQMSERAVAEPNTGAVMIRMGFGVVIV